MHKRGLAHRDEPTPPAGLRQPIRSVFGQRWHVEVSERDRMRSADALSCTRCWWAPADARRCRSGRITGTLPPGTPQKLWRGCSFRRLVATACIGGVLLGFLGFRYFASSQSIFASLLAKPLHVPALLQGKHCPATRGTPIESAPFAGGVAFGRGPVRLLIANEGDLQVGQVDLGSTVVPGWSALQTLWISVPSYKGPFVVRARRLGESGPIEVQSGGSGLLPGNGPLLVSSGSTLHSQDGYRTVQGSTWVRSAGCYAWEVDGQHFSEVIVVDMVKR